MFVALVGDALYVGGIITNDRVREIAAFRLAFEESSSPSVHITNTHKHLVERLELRRRLYGILRNILDTAFLYFQSVCIELAVILFLQVSNETKSAALRQFYKITRFIDNLFVIA